MTTTLSVPRRVAAALLAVLVMAAPAFAQNFSVIHSFGFLGFDGDIPLGLMEASDGNFYGTTAYGPNHAQGEGTVFRMTPAGAVTMIHQFHFEGDPGSLVQGSDGNLYGIVGSKAFRLSLDGSVYQVIHTFTADEGSMLNGLTRARDGSFYGTATRGGEADYGSVFRMTTSGEVTVVHSFDVPEGVYPQAAVVEGADGNLYGTTVLSGGASPLGTVFKMSPDGTFTAIHEFTGGTADGALPRVAVTQGLDGAFYGTTAYGGRNSLGVVFRVTADGAFSVVHHFSSAEISFVDQAPLVQTSDGSWYGTAGRDSQSTAVYRIRPNGTLTILHTTFSIIEGAGGHGVVHGRDGNLYGVMQVSLVGEASATGGTAFRVTNPAPCDNELSLEYATGTLTARFTVKSTSVGQWGVWLVDATDFTQLWNVPLGVVSPAVSLDVPMAPFPPSGTVAVYTALVNGTSTCTNWKIVDTGQ